MWWQSITVDGWSGLQQVFSACRKYVNTAFAAGGALLFFFLARKIDLGWFIDKYSSLKRHLTIEQNSKKKIIWIIILSRIDLETSSFKGLLNPDQNWAKSDSSSYLFWQDKFLLCLQRGAPSKKVLQSIPWCSCLLTLPGRVFHRANSNFCGTFCSGLK